jgi:ribosome-binding factor A
MTHRNATASAKGPTQRQMRVGEMLRHALSDIFRRGDMRHATVFVEPLGGRNGAQVVTALNRHARYLRGEMGHLIALKFTPELRFVEDTSFAEAEKIEGILKSERVRRDLKHNDDS